MTVWPVHMSHWPHGSSGFWSVKEGYISLSWVPWLPVGGTTKRSVSDLGEEAHVGAEAETA